MGRPVAGKTGTSNDQMDAWFIGYTPEWVCGVWSGFDLKRSIGPKETGGVVAAPIFLRFMNDFLTQQDKLNYERLDQEARSQAEKLGVPYLAPEPLVPLDFSVPDGVDPVLIDKAHGTAVEADSPDAFLEYFKKGTGPNSAAVQKNDSYWDSPEL